MLTVDPSPISLIIATYNRGPCIAETLDSVLRQSLAVNEILVIDDCSPDHTGDWVRENYPNVRVVRRDTNGGTSASRNAGAKQARNNWLIFLDHDDLLLPDAVKTLVSLRDRFPEARACFTDHVTKTA